jgi:hypothetical protein
VLTLPLVDSAPLQPPLAVHEVAFVELQVNIEAPPLGTTVGEAVKVTRGMILTVAVAGTLVPPGPVQLSVYAVGIVSAPVLMFPPVDSPPLQPPLAVHEAAFVELQVNIEAAPLETAVGEAIKVTSGMILTVAVAGALVPPGPVQVSE